MNSEDEVEEEEVSESPPVEEVVEEVESPPVEEVVETETLPLEVTVEEKPTLTIVIEVFENQKPIYVFTPAEGMEMKASQILQAKRRMDRAYRIYQRDQRKKE